MRYNTKVGDVFCVKISDNTKKYFQYVVTDLTQLNSDVIRAFKKEFKNDANPDILEIVNGKVEFYAHCVTKQGLQMKLWEKIGNISEVGNIQSVIFKDTSDYGVRINGEPIRTSADWYIWHINDEDFTSVGRLEGENRKAFNGLVINPVGIIELLKGNKYPINYPDFE
jgi:hypothetical protein